MSVDTKTDGIEAQLKAIADPARRRILELLRRKGGCSCADVPACDPGKCVCDLEADLKLSQPTITHHVQVLRDAGLVRTEKIGRWLYCNRDEAALDRLAEWLKEL
jgi:ArsR family transcriptional regulator